jgi:peroxiredoxin
VSTTTEDRPLAVGDPAPDFTLKSVGLREVSLRDYRRHKHVVLLFYPLDWTPG